MNNSRDFFDSKWFKDQTVFLLDAHINELDWAIKLSQDDVDLWQDQNNERNAEYQNIAKAITDKFTVDLLTIPMQGENKVVHHFEKVLWLIQDYCRKGWKNRLKAANHLDNGRFMVHPGTNRCLAAEFLGCKTLPIMLSVHKEQKCFETFSGVHTEITTERKLRTTLFSTKEILFRTEVEEKLFVDGKHIPKKMFKDFTYEFLGKDAWPDKNMPTDYVGFLRPKFYHWSDLVSKSLPLNIYGPNINNCKIFSNIIGKKYNNIEKNIYSTLDIKLNECNDINKVPKLNRYEGIAIWLDRDFQRDIFELLFLMDPQMAACANKEKDLVVINCNHPNNRKNIAWSQSLRMPRHYVKKV